MLISGTYSYLATTANGGNVQNANGYDVIFTSDSACATKLNHEVKTYTSSTGAVNYWVKVPTLSHTTDTTIYLCYGNSAITTDQSNKTAVWDTNYKGVWHLNDNAANTTVTDSTGANNGMNQANTSSKTATGKTGKALSYNGSSDYTDLGTNVGNYTLSTSFTVEAWINPALDSANRAIYGNAYALAGYLLRVNTANKGRFVVITNGSNFSGRDSSLLSSGWHHVVVVWNGSGTAHVYIDGALDDAATVSGGSVTTITTSAHTRIGAAPESGYESFFNGTIDEVRSSNTARSADWIKTEYNNQNSPTTFYSISSATAASANLHWLVADQLGTPRMVFDESGNLANVKRHDYLPFGEEIAANVGSRTTTQGYSSSDGVRQQFTQKERDNETGLDYFRARYYASSQGRFTSADSFTGSKSNPQTLNRYSYSGSNPLRLVDPTGHYPVDAQRVKKGEKPSGGDAPPCWPKCGLYPGQAPAISETVTVSAGEPSPLATTAPDVTSVTLTMTPMLQVPTGPPMPTPDPSGAGGHVMPGWLNNLLPSFGGFTAGYGGAAVAAGNGLALNSSVTVGRFRDMPGSYSFWNRGGLVWDKPWAAGIPAFAGLGVGGGLAFSNAQTPGEMNGDAQAFTLGLGVAAVEFDLGSGSFHRPIWTLSVTAGPGKAFGLMTMPVRTTTWDHWTDPVNPWADW